VSCEIKEEIAYEMLEYAAVCFIMSTQKIPNAKAYGEAARCFQMCANGWLEDIREEKLLRKCLEECSL